MAVDAAAGSAAMLAMTQAIGAFTTFLPPLTEVRKGSANDPEFAADVRVGELAASTLTVGVGAIVSSLTGSPAPTFVAVFTAFGLVLLYESTLRNGTVDRATLPE